MDQPESYRDLKALFVNTSLKRSPQTSHTDTLMDVARGMMKNHGVAVDSIRLADHAVPAGVQPDMREHGYTRDDWPQLWQQVLKAHILVIGSPIWLGAPSSLCVKLIERLYAQSAQTNPKGQYVFYGKVGGCLVTGNEDGIKNVSSQVLYAMSHLGYTIPPQADAGWIGEAGPGPSYGDKADDGSRVGFDNDFTKRNTTFMTWNLLHMARILKDSGGIPAWGNLPQAWKDGEHFGFEEATR